MNFAATPRSLRPVSTTPMLRSPSQLAEKAKIKEGYKAKVQFLYDNQAYLSPVHCGAVRADEPQSLRLWKPFSSEECKGVLYRSMFKACYCNINEKSFQKSMTLFHDHFAELCSHVYPFNFVSREYKKK